MRILVACERSGVVREAFRARGHEAWSCDLLPSADGSPYHLEADVLRFINKTVYYPEPMPFGSFGDYWDMIIAHPPCRFLSVSGARWFDKRKDEQEQAIWFAEQLWDSRCKMICIENPVGVLSTNSLLGKPSQIVQPYEFGDNASKKTCLWLKGLPRLIPTSRISGRIVDGRERWANQTDSGQNRLGPSEHRAAIRAVTYQGIANAMAQQWTADPTAKP
jgi:site-specific DNA-cytosine methylase